MTMCITAYLSVVVVVYSRTDLSAHFLHIIASRLLFYFHSFSHILKKETGQKMEE